MNAVILGATRGMGRALARLLAHRGDRLFLLGRDPEELRRSAADLDARSAAARRDPGHRAVAGTATCDLLRPDSFRPALQAAETALGRLETVVITAADFATQEELEGDPERAHRLLAADFSATVYLCELARRRLLEDGGGTLCVFSSVAGDRARKPVVLYGAAKAGLSAYMEGLDHRYRGDGLRAVCVKPGFVKTGMTAGLEPPPFAGEPEAVARRVLRAIDRGTPVVYAPPVWRWVMAVIRRLPRGVMRRVGF